MTDITPLPPKEEPSPTGPADKKEPVTKEKVLVTEAQTREHEKAELLKEIGAILHQFGGESNIPLNHDYWNKVNRFRGL